MSDRTAMWSAVLTGTAVFFILLSLNRPLFFFINEVHGPVADRLMLTITHLGNGAVVGLVVILLVPFRRDISLRALTAMILAGLMVTFLKEILGFPRPVSVFGGAVHVLGPKLYANSMPSGHTATAFAAAFSVWGMVPPRVGRGLLAVAFLVGFSRIYVGAHFPLDVFMGAATGLLAGLTAAAIIRAPSKKPPPGGPLLERILLTVGAVMGIWVAWFDPMLHYNPYVLRPLGIAGLLLVLVFLGRSLRGAVD